MTADLTDVVIDFETFYDAEYSLSKMTNIEYVLDPRFEIIGVSVKVADNPTVWLSGPLDYIRLQLMGLIADWSKVRLIAHNLMFDGAIAEWILGIRAGAYFCTMMASRPYVAPYTGSMSLASVAKHLGVGEKGREVENFKGYRRQDFNVYELERYANYCKNDTELTAKAAATLRGWMPEDEQYLVNLTLRKYLRPVFRVDETCLTEAEAERAAEMDSTYKSIRALNVDEEQIRSRAKFASLLRHYGVDPPKKISKTTGEETDAFAKDDEEFIELLVHDVPEVRTLVQARLKLSSSIERTRLERFRDVHRLNLGGEHLFPIPLLYYAAHPGRFGGTEKLNVQNLPRPDKKNPRRGALRRSLVAPSGHSVIAADYSNIEARIVATLAGQWDLVAAFARGEDIYSKFASLIYRKPINKDDNPVERFVGKTCILGLGYGMGAARFRKTMAMAQVKMPLQEAHRIVQLYRDTYPNIPTLWRTLETQLKQCVMPGAMFQWGPLTFAYQRIILPNGMPIIYPDLQFDRDQMNPGLCFTSRRRGSRPLKNHLWGGIVTENVTQALARIIATRAEVRIARAGLPMAHQAHDELIWVARDEHVPLLLPAIERAMCDPVGWLPNLPIAVEIHHGKSYGDCK